MWGVDLSHRTKLKKTAEAWFARNPGRHTFNRVLEGLGYPPREQLQQTLHSLTSMKRILQHGSREWEMKTTKEVESKPNGLLNRAALFGAFKQLDGQATKTQLRKALHHDPASLLAEVEAEGLIEGKFGVYRVLNRALLGLAPIVKPESEPAEKVKPQPRETGRWKTDPWSINPYNPDSGFGLIVEALRAARPGALTIDGILQLTNGPRQSTQAALTTMGIDGYARKAGQGLWEASVPADPVKMGTTRSRILCATAPGEDFTLKELCKRLGGDLSPTVLWRSHLSPGCLVTKFPELSTLGDPLGQCFHRKSAEDYRREQLLREAPRQEERKAIATAPAPAPKPAPAPVVAAPVKAPTTLTLNAPVSRPLPADPLAQMTIDLKTQLEERIKAAGQLAEALTGILGDLHRLDGAVRSLDPTHPPFVVPWGPALVSAVEGALKPKTPWTPYQTPPVGPQGPTYGPPPGWKPPGA